ncbi:MAG: malonate decarboxylase subunit alpha [Hadesarchaea archaeon]|nr:malonate decarboxylase subunit alpha [Hadesarchaea archaeon]
MLGNTSKKILFRGLRMEVVPSEEAINQIENNDNVAIGGFTTTNLPLELFHALRDSFDEKGEPRDLTIVQPAGQSGGENVGSDVLGVEGLMKKMILTHSGLAPQTSNLIMNNKIIAYCLPQGVISQLFRNIAAGRPYLITHTGLHTFVDPRVEGGKVNDITKEKEDIVELTEHDGEEYLLYKTLPIDFALIRGTTADKKGNISMEKEGVTLENLSIAQAANNSGGKVAVQVEDIVDGPLPSRSVEIPGILVDYVVESTKPEYNQQTVNIDYDPAISGEKRVSPSEVESKPLNERKVIGRRGAIELETGAVINLGIGMSTEVADVAMEENIYEEFTLTVESGVIGGVPLAARDFGVGINYDALIDQPYQFDFYQGGGLDLAFLGMAQVDESGNVNVSRFGGRFAGCGGFIDITQNAQKVVFCGTFTAKGLEVEVGDGELNIIQEGSINKLVEDVDQITYSGAYGVEREQEVLYITERCVFSLGEDGLLLEEIAPGIDLEEDVLDKMDFSPEISSDLETMDEEIFRESKMDIEPK